MRAHGSGVLDFRYALALALMLALGWPACGRAQDRIPVFMLDFVPQGGEVPSRVVRKLSEFLRAELESSSVLIPFPGSDIQRLAEGKESRFELENLKSLVAEMAAQARTDYLNFKFKRALANFERARDLLTREGGRVRDFDTLTDILLRIAASHLAQGQGERANQALLALFRLSPEYQIDSSEFPPKLVKRAERMRRKLARDKRGAISISSDPGFAEVLLDGRPVGETPLVKKDVLSGQHFLCLHLPEHHDHCTELKVKPGKTAEVSVQLAANPSVMTFRHLFEKTAEGAPRKETLVMATDFGEAIGAQRVLVGGVAEDAGGFLVSVALIDSEAGTLSRLLLAPLDAELNSLKELSRSIAAALVEPGGNEPLPLTVGGQSIGSLAMLDFGAYLLGISSQGAATALVGGTGGEGGAGGRTGSGGETETLTATLDTGQGRGTITEPPPDPGTEPVVGQDDKWYEKWWVWTIVGVVVAGGAVTTGVLLGTAEDEPNAVRIRFNQGTP